MPPATNPRKFETYMPQSSHWCNTHTTASVMSVFMMPMALYLMKWSTESNIKKGVRGCGHLFELMSVVDYSNGTSSTRRFLARFFLLLLSATGISEP